MNDTRSMTSDQLCKALGITQTRLAAVSPPHPDVIVKLKQAMGDLSAAVDAINDDWPCLIEVVRQLHAVEGRIGDIKRELINDHVDQFLIEAADGSTRGRAAEQVLADIKTLTDYL